MAQKIRLLALIVATLSTIVCAIDFIGLGQALSNHQALASHQVLPGHIDAASIVPVFDFDVDSCLPAAGISRNGHRNGGLKPFCSLTGGCRSSNFLELSNTVHRYACTELSGAIYWNCNGGNHQKWYLEASSGQIHNRQDPQCCLDSSSVLMFQTSNGAVSLK